jgi:hypothetical protein
MPLIREFPQMDSHHKPNKRMVNSIIQMGKLSEKSQNIVGRLSLVR